MWNVILYNNFGWNCFCQVLACLPLYCIFEYVRPTFFWCWMWQMLLSQLVCNHWMLLADVICQVVVVWLMFFAILADGIATFVCLWKMKATFEWLEIFLTVADGIATVWIGWCYTNNTTCSLTKNSPIATLVLAGKCEQVQNIRWITLQNNTTAKLLPKIPNNTNLQLEPDTNNSYKSIPRCRDCWWGQGEAERTTRCQTRQHHVPNSHRYR